MPITETLATCVRSAPAEQPRHFNEHGVAWSLHVSERHRPAFSIDVSGHDRRGS